MAPILSKDVKFRPLVTRAYPGAAGQTRDALPTTEVYQSLNVRLTAALNARASIALRPENILGMIRGFTLEGTSNNRRAAYGRFKQGDFAAYYNLLRFLRNVSGAVTPLTVSAIPALEPASADVQIDFEFPHSSDPRRTYLNSAKDLQTLTAIIDWGDYPDLNSVAVAPGDTLVGQVVISGRELTDTDIKKYNFGVNTFSYLEKPTNGVAAADFQFDLRQGRLLRGILIKCYTQAAGATFHTPTDALVNSLRFTLNRETKVEYFDWPTLQGQNLIDYHMAAVPVGYAFIDFMEDGNFAKIIPTSAYTDVTLSFNVAALADARIRVYPVEIFPVLQS
jgi:hypothetical protein